MSPEDGLKDLLGAVRRGAEGRLIEARLREEELRAELTALESQRQAALADRDALAAYLRRLEARRAELVSLALELGALEGRRGASEQRGALIERLATGLIALDLRPGSTSMDLVDGGAARHVGDPGGPVDVVVLAPDAGAAAPTIAHLRNRTPDVADVRVSGPDAPLGEALAAGRAPFVVLARSGATVPWGWRRTLLGTVAVPGHGAAVPLSPDGLEPARLRLPAEARRLGVDAIALVVASVFHPAAQPAQGLGGPLVVVRREALEAIETPPDGAPADVLGELGERLVAADWVLAVADTSYVEGPGDEAADDARPRRRRTSTAAPTATPTVVAAEDAIAATAGAPGSIGSLLARTGPLPRLAYVLPGDGSLPPALTDLVLTETAGLRDLGVPVQLVAVHSTIQGPTVDGARRVRVDELPAALAGFDAAVAPARSTWSVVEEAAAAAGSVMVIVLDDHRHPTLPDGAIVLTTDAPEQDDGRIRVVRPTIDDRLFVPRSVQADARLVVGLRRRGTDAEHQARVDALQALATSLAIEPYDRAMDRHALADCLGRCDIVVDPEPGPGSDRELLAAMACGAVPVVAATAPRASGAPAPAAGAVLVAAGDELVGAVRDLASDWAALRERRTAAMRFAEQHGRIAGAADRYAAITVALRARAAQAPAPSSTPPTGRGAPSASSRSSASA